VIACHPVSRATAATPVSLPLTGPDAPQGTIPGDRDNAKAFPAQDSKELSR